MRMVCILLYHLKQSLIIFFVTEELINKMKEDLKKASLRIETLERYLVLRTEQTQKAKLEQEEMKERLRQLDEDFEKEKMDRFHIASDMVRQYKAMQDELITKINDLENKKIALKEQLYNTQIALEQTKQEKDKIIEQKDKEIIQYKQRIDDMVKEFGDMLRDVLQKMGTSLEESSKAAASGVTINLPNLQKLKEFARPEIIEMEQAKQAAQQPINS